MKNVFITGLAGFIGSHLAEYLLSKGYKVYGCDSLISGSESNVPSQAGFYELDCAESHKIEALLKKHQIELIYHAAATAYDNFSLFSPVKITQNIMGSTMSMMTAGINAGIKRFVYFSSMARYGNAKEVPFKESLQPTPVTPYGTAKFAAELGVQNLAKAHNLDFTVCVPHNVYGPKQKFDDPFRNVISIMINRVLSNKSPIVYGSGEQLRSYTYITDILPILESLGVDSRANGQTFNIGPDNEFVSINQITKIICQSLNVNRDNIHIDGRPMEVSQAYCSSDKIREFFNYQTNISLEEGIGKTIDWVKSVGPKEFDYFLEPEIKKSNIPETWSRKLM